MVGAQYTNTIVALPSGALSSVTWDVPVGGTISYTPEWSGDLQSKAVLVRDLACPTWGIASITAGYGSLLVGPPYSALIVPPSQLKSFDPQWAKCPYWFQEGRSIISWAITDPPLALTPAISMDAITRVPLAISSPSITSVEPVKTSPASPASSRWNVYAPATSLSTSMGATSDAVPRVESIFNGLETQKSGKESFSQAAESANALPIHGTTVTQGQISNSVEGAGQTKQRLEDTLRPWDGLTLALESEGVAEPVALSALLVKPSLGAIDFSTIRGKPTTTATVPLTQPETFLNIGFPKQTAEGTAVSVDGSIILHSDSPQPTAEDTNLKDTLQLTEATITTMAPTQSSMPSQTTTFGSGDTLGSIDEAVTVHHLVYFVEPPGIVKISTEADDLPENFITNAQANAAASSTVVNAASAIEAYKPGTGSTSSTYDSSNQSSILASRVTKTSPPGIGISITPTVGINVGSIILDPFVGTSSRATNMITFSTHSSQGTQDKLMAINSTAKVWLVALVMILDSFIANI